MEDTLRNIRKDCRQAMNGAVSASMREYGLDYKLNFGLVIQQIRTLADKYGPSAPLADQLWKETTRELKILSTLIYPVAEFTKETANRWVKEIPNQEIREQVCVNLFQELPYATQLAKEWSNDADTEIRTTGYWLMARLLLSKKIEGSISVNDFGENMWSDIISEELFLRNASSLVLKHLVRNSKEEADHILNKLLPYKADSNLIKQEAYNAITFEIEFLYH